MADSTLAGKPRLLKQANLSLVRKVIKAEGTVTRAQITAQTNISPTTVRALLAEMLQKGEIESIGYDASSGGRKAERYRFAPDRYHCAALCISGRQLHGLLVNACGEVVRTDVLPAPDGDGDFEPAICAYLDSLLAHCALRSIGVGVPGIVEGGGYWRKSEQDGQLHKIDLGARLHRRYGIPVVLENDLNATAIGFHRCYAREYPGEDARSADMVYLNFERGCVSAGLIAGGKIIRGHRNFAGELGLVPLADGRPLDDHMDHAADDAQYTRLVVQVLVWLCGVLNPQYIALGGPAFRKSCLAPISDGLFALLPGHMCAEVLYAGDAWHDYHSGMAYLTAEKMFDEVLLLQE